MSRRRKAAIAGAVALVLGAGGVGVAVATGGDDAEEPITGPALSRASDAARDHVGGGRVAETEVGDEDSFYEVEVVRPDGSRVDVQLDRNFEVVGDEVDGESEPGDEED